MPRSRLSRALAPLVVAAVAGCAATDGPGPSPTPSSPPSSAASSAARTSSAAGTGSAARTGPLRVAVEVVARGLTDGWDVGFLPGGAILVSERAGRFAVVEPGTGVVRRLSGEPTQVYAVGEGGLMGFVLHPDVATSGLLTACLDHRTPGGGAGDVRVVTYRLLGPAGAPTGVERVRDLVTGLPINPSGRHSGCRPTLAPDGALVVGTGDTAVGSIPQDLTSLGGKTLRMDLATGAPAAGNPFLGAADPRTRLIWTYGHRNVQGVAVRPGTGEIVTAEHGPDRDDEVNILRAGGNYGWDPSRGGTVGGYDEAVPMTDLTRFPAAVPAAWSSGRPTEAVCGAAFLSGPAWGAYDGALAVAALKGSKVLIMRFGGDGRVTSVEAPAELAGPYGRLRAARLGPDGALYVTSSHGGDDVLMRVRPA